MKKRAIKLYDKFVLLVLSFLGLFTSCNFATMYGTPYAEFEVKGSVTSKETKQPIEGIRVIRPMFEYGDTTYTDANGRYLISFRRDGGLYELEKDTTDLKIEDIDGVKNGGEFETKEFSVSFADAEVIKEKKRKNPWYEGKASKEVNIELGKKIIENPDSEN